jgi:hypothetical protein
MQTNQQSAAPALVMGAIMSMLAVIMLLVLSGCKALDIIKDQLPGGGDIVITDPGTDTPDDPDTPPDLPDASSDAIPLNTVRWLGPNISAWPITTELTLSISGGVFRLHNDKSRLWPGGLEARGGGQINGNAWVFVNVGGTWHAATWEYLRVGQHEKKKEWVKGTDGHINSAPLSTWVPRSGETYGFMVSTLARGGVRTINERSNVSLITWP